MDIRPSSSPQQEKNHPNANGDPAARPFSEGNAYAPSFISRVSLNSNLPLPGSAPAHQGLKLKSKIDSAVLHGIVKNKQGFEFN
jgi:hypothetical protein